MPRALVTGGAGFLGSHLARTLELAGWEVCSLDVNPALGSVPTGRQCIEADVRDVTAVAQAAKGADVIVANAAIVPLAHRSVSDYFDTNVGGTEAVLRAAALSGAYVLHISSSAIYGIPLELPIRSSTPCAPIDPYGQSKLAAELVVYRARIRGQTVGILRPRTLVGRGRLGLFDLIFSRIRAGRRVPIFGDGRNRVQLCDVEDFCAAALAAIQQRSNSDFNIGAVDYGTVREDMTSLIATAATGARLQAIPARLLRCILQPLGAIGQSPFTAWHYRVGPLSFYCDVGGAMDELSWQPCRSNAETLIAAYRDYDDTPGASGSSTHSQPLGGGFARVLRGGAAP